MTSLSFKGRAGVGMGGLRREGISGRHWRNEAPIPTFPLKGKESQGLPVAIPYR